MNDQPIAVPIFFLVALSSMTVLSLLSASDGRSVSLLAAAASGIGALIAAGVLLARFRRARRSGDRER